MAMNYGPQQGFQGQNMPPQGMAPPPKKKGMSTGCIIAIVMVLVFFGSIAGIVLYFVYAVSQNKDVQNIMGAIGDAAKLAAEAQNAPGTKELRAAGCQEAMALDTEKMKKLISSFVDAGPGAAPEMPGELDTEKMVVCKASPIGSTPKCDDLAKTYAGAAHLKGQFMLSVQQNNATTCTGIYSSSGAVVTSGTPGKTK